MKGGLQYDGTKGLDFYPLDDGTYAVGAGTAKLLSSIVIPSTYNGAAVTEIIDSGFQYCEQLTCITIPDSVITIGVDAFYGCGSLESVTVGDGVKTIGGYAFANCRVLKNVTISKSLLKSLLFSSSHVSCPSAL